MSIDLNTASKAEMKEYGRDELGLTLTMNMSEDTMRQRIRDQLTELGRPEPEKPINLGQKGKEASYVEINIAKSKEKGGARPVPVGVNGVMYTVPRGKNVLVPPSVEYVLRKAVATTYEQDDETGQMHDTDSLRFPYQVVGGFGNLIPDADSKAA